ncbi:hypothetical protein EJB05_36889, partial [Eragrostis curvula]
MNGGGGGLVDMVYFPAYFILLLLICFCKSDNQLTRTTPLGMGDMLISDNGIFALGFFSPAARSNNQTLYIGIWFHNLSVRTVVWVANRDSPASAASSPTLAISTTSDHLVLSDSKGRNLWTTQSNVVTAGGTGATAVLLGTGNLVLRSPNGTDIWQSFNHPTDTILPGMKFLMAHRAHAVGLLVAWKGPHDPSAGDFSFGLDPVSNIQMVIWHGARPYCRISVWNAGVSVSSGMFPSGAGTIVYQTIVNTEDEFYFMYTAAFDSSLYSRITLDHTGTMKLLIWSDNSSSWAVVSEHPTSSYGLYGSCGSNGYSDFAGVSPACRCLEGFEPNGLNFTMGCRRKEALQCSKGSHFVAMPGMRVPDGFVLLRNRSFEQCAAECGRNCSCTAYAYANLSSAGVTADRSRCLVWTGDLVDAWKTSNYGEQLYLRLADAPAQKKTNLVKIVVPLMACLLLLTCIALVWICKFREKWLNKEIEKKLTLGYLNASSELGEFPFVSFTDIVRATDNFSDSNVLGKGGFGKVYKGIFEGGKEVAIKRLSQGSEQGVDECRNEVVLLVKLQHRNLVRLLGCCIREDEKLLIYEYLPNRSLDAFLFGICSCSKLLDYILHFLQLWEEGNATELVDSSVVENCPLHEALRCIHVGLLCVQDNPNARPLMSSVLFMLESETTLLPEPKEPVYSASRRNRIEETRNMGSSLNMLSITTLEGR